MARKIHEISFNIAGRIESTFKGAFSSASSQIRTLGNDVKTLKGTLRTLDDEYKKGAMATEAYQRAHQRLTSQLEKTEQVQKRLRDATQQQSELQQRAADIHGNMVDTAVMASPFVASAKAAMNFEDAMLGVARQVQGARDSNGQLTQVYYDMGKQIQQLGREIPIATNEIVEMVTAGARMGVAREELIGFTRTAAMMATAFDAPAGELAEKMGKVATNFKIPITAVNGLADSINYLDDNAISKGTDIIEVLNRISGQAQQVGMSSKDAAALASTFLTTGSSAEVAATAANAMMRELAIASEQPARFDEGLKALGLTASEVQKGMAKDATGTIQKVLTAINKLPKDQQTAVTVQLFGKEYGDDAARLAQNIGEFRRQLALANGEAAKGSMGREFAARLQTSSAQMQMMKNSMTEAAVAMGTVMLPTLNEVFSGVARVSQKVAELSAEHPTLTKVIVLGTAGLIAFRVATLGVSFAMNSAKIAGNALSIMFLRQTAAQTAATTASTVAAVATQRLTIAQRLLNIAMSLNPIGLVITGIGLLVAAGVYLYNNWEQVKQKATQLWEVIQNNPILAVIAGPISNMIAAGSFLISHWDNLGQGLSDLWIRISNYFREGANNVIQSLNNIIDGINNLTGTSIPKLQELQLDYSVQVRQMNERKIARNMDVDGSHANGLREVPFNGYIAELHEGEGVLTKAENKRYLNGEAPAWSSRSRSMATGGSSQTVQFVYAPNIQGGNAGEIAQVLQEDRRSFETQANAWIHQQRRVSFSV